jgi:hypothetical protein
MADQQQVPSELAAAMQQGQGEPAAPGQAPAPPMPPAMAPVDEQEVCAALMRAIQTCAMKGPAAADPREVNEFAKSALAYAQAYVQIHPGLVSPQGVAPGVLAAAAPAIVPPESNAETEPKPKAADRG